MKQRKAAGAKKKLPTGGKQKTYSRAKKRVRLTGTKKVRVEKPSHNHLLNQKSTRQKNLSAHPRELGKAELNKIEKLLPHSF